VVSQQFGAIVSGIGLHAWNLSHALARDGHRVTAVIPKSQMPRQVEADIDLTTAPATMDLNRIAQWIMERFEQGARLLVLTERE
jgi:hypothetical protein